MRSFLCLHNFFFIFHSKENRKNIYIFLVNFKKTCISKFDMQFLINFFRDIFYAMLQLLSFGRKKIQNSLSVYIKSNTGNTISLDLNPEWDIKNVKELIAPKLGLSPEEVKIIFAGKELADSTHISVSSQVFLAKHSIF